MAPHNQGGEVLAQRFAPHGFAVAAVAVRSSSQATFPAQVHDGKAAGHLGRAGAPSDPGAGRPGSPGRLTAQSPYQKVTVDWTTVRDAS
jgi:hypothetical protein